MMDIQRERMLKEIMAYDFYLVELNLFLDTHPTNEKAINLFNETLKKARVLRENFEKVYGPLTTYNSFSGTPWQWINSPWPWEND